MLNKLVIKNAAFYAYHGVLAEEKKLGGRYEVDAELFTSFLKASAGDNIEDTLDYSMVYSDISRHVTGKSYNLIETLAVRIALDLLKRYERLEKVSVTVRKYNVPIDGKIDHVEAVVSIDRSELNGIENE